MSADTAADFFALCLVGGVVGTAVALVVPSLRSQVAESALALAAVVAVGATAGSLYFSEVADLLPCKLCWFQRIAMYPLAVILPLAAIRRDADAAIYALPLATAGALIAGYHVQLQLFPEQSSFCELSNPCTSSLVEGLGFATIPRMSAASFALVIVLLALARMSPRQLPHPQLPQTQRLDHE